MTHKWTHKERHIYHAIRKAIYVGGARDMMIDDAEGLYAVEVYLHENKLDGNSSAFLNADMWARVAVGPAITAAYEADDMPNANQLVPDMPAWRMADSQKEAVNAALITAGQISRLRPYGHGINDTIITMREMLAGSFRPAFTQAEFDAAVTKTLEYVQQFKGGKT